MAAPTSETFPLMLFAGRLAALVPEEDIRAVQDYFHRRDSLGPILNPTAYREEMDQADRCRKLAAAYATFAGVCRELAANERANLPDMAWPESASSAKSADDVVPESGIRNPELGTAGE